MKTMQIEWRHFDKAGETCDRCAATGISVKEVVAELATELTEREVSLNFTETLLSKEQMGESNLILIDGIPLEAVLDDAKADENHCQSCSCLTGAETNCRTVQYEGTSYEEIPAELIRRAIYKACGINEL